MPFKSNALKNAVSFSLVWLSVWQLSDQSIFPWLILATQLLQLTIAPTQFADVSCTGVQTGLLNNLTSVYPPWNLLFSYHKRSCDVQAWCPSLQSPLNSAQGSASNWISRKSLHHLANGCKYHSTGFERRPNLGLLQQAFWVAEPVFIHELLRAQSSRVCIDETSPLFMHNGTVLALNHDFVFSVYFWKSAHQIYPELLVVLHYVSATWVRMVCSSNFSFPVG